jgi:hypothetical protein
MSSAPFHQKLPPASLMRALNSPAPRSHVPHAPHGSNGSAARQMDLYIEKPHPILTASDLAPDWDVSEDQIFRLIEEGRILAFFINTEDTPKHRHYRIVRHATARGQSLTVSGMLEVIATTDTWLFPIERWGRKQNFLTEHAAEIIDVSPRHIRKLYDVGQLGAKNLGAATQLSLRIPRPELTAFVQRRLTLTNNL